MEITMMCDVCVGRDFCNWNCKEYPNCFQTEQEKSKKKKKGGINMFITNAFSLQMLQEFPVTVKVEEIPLNEVKKLQLQSAIGHQDTAKILSNLLDQDIKVNRINITLHNSESIIVAQLQGGRLPEGSTKLPQGFSFKFLKVTVQA